MTTTVYARYVIEIPDWRPTLLNDFMRIHYLRRSRIQQKDTDMIGVYAIIAAVPPATGKRRVTIEIIHKKGEKRCDPDAPLKVTLDALVALGLLIDDSADFCEPVGKPIRGVGKTTDTRIILEDIEG